MLEFVVARNFYPERQILLQRVQLNQGYSKAIRNVVPIELQFRSGEQASASPAVV
jgi:hypothetical protein